MKKNFLSKAFNYILLGAGLSLAAMNCGNSSGSNTDGDDPGGSNKGEKLRTGESVLGYTFLGPLVDVSKIRIEFKNEASPTLVESKGYLITVFKTCTMPDLSKSANIECFGAFVRALAMIEIYANGRSGRPQYDNNIYGYPTNNSALIYNNMGDKSAATMLEDYARRNFHPGARSKWVADTAAIDTVRNTIVENKFWWLYYPRQNFDPAKFGQ